MFCLRPGENAPRAYYAWIIPPEGKENVEVVELGEAGKIEKLVAKFIEHQQTVPERFKDHEDAAKAEDVLSRECLSELSQLMLGRVWKLASKYRRWTICPDGELWKFPWETLLLPKKSDKSKFLYAVEEIDFRYILSGRDLVKKEVEKSKGEPWILADPEFNRQPGIGWRRRKDLEGLKLLEEAREEGKKVAHCLEDLFENGNWRVQPRTSTKEKLLGLDPPPRILYLATHGFSPLPTPPVSGGRSSALLWSRPGEFRLHPRCERETQDVASWSDHRGRGAGV